MIITVQQDQETSTMTKKRMREWQLHKNTRYEVGFSKRQPAKLKILSAIALIALRAKFTQISIAPGKRLQCTKVSITSGHKAAEKTKVRASAPLASSSPVLL